MSEQNILASNDQADFSDWSKEYDRLIQNPPKEGDILQSADSSKVILVIELKEHAPPFVYGRAYVPEIVGMDLGWFLQSAGSEGYFGWKCILLPRARTELIQKYGLRNEVVEIVSLRVIRHSVSGKSLLCEVHRYGDEEEKKVVGPAQLETKVEVEAESATFVAETEE